MDAERGRSPEVPRPAARHDPQPASTCASGDVMIVGRKAVTP